MARDNPLRGSPGYLTDQIITYIGNKRSLLPFIEQGIRAVKAKLGVEHLSFFDVFSGSGIVSRYARKHSKFIIANDLELYSTICNKCYLQTPNAQTLTEIRQANIQINNRIEREGFLPGFFAELYAPANDGNIQPNERAFFTTRNAKFLDTARQLISSYSEGVQPYLLAPLITRASVCANTSGVFKGFYKNSTTGCGQYGGNGKNALDRITRHIDLPLPIFSEFNVECQIIQGDANQVIGDVGEVDLAYIDPPYNQHPYGSNYFMLNLLAEYKRPTNISLVSGIPTGWNRSDYNKKSLAHKALSELVANIKAKYLLVSFNSEGFISKQEMLDMLSAVGTVEVLEQRYSAFKGSRNLSSRPQQVTEYLFVVAKE